MPVLVDRNAVPLQLAGRVVPQDTGESLAYAEAARTYAQIAGQAGQLMAAQTEEEATALARSVELDERGQPILPDGVNRARFGALAALSFDRTLRIRQERALAMDAERIVNEVRDRNQYDPEGFANEVGPVIEGMVEETPPELRGVLQDAVKGVVTDTASRIGWAKGQLDREQAGSQFGVDATGAADRIWTAAQAGRVAEVDREIAEVTAIAEDLTARGIITPLQKDGALRELHAAKGAAAVLGTIASEDWTAADIREAELHLRVGDDPAYNALFPDEQSRWAGAQRLGTIASLMEGKDYDAAKAAETAARMDLVVKGATTATNENRALLDDYFSGVLGRRLAPEDWLSGRVRDARVWQQVRQTGYAPASLIQAFTIFANGAATPETRGNVYAMWKELSAGRAPDGTPVDISGELPERAVARLTLMEGLVAGGMSDPSGAYDRAGLLLSEPPDPEKIAARLRTDDPFGSDRAATLAAEDVDGYLERGLGVMLQDSLGEPATRAQVQRGTRLLKIMLTAGDIPTDEALRMVTRGIEAEAAETGAIWTPGFGRASRSPFAPEKHYAVPADSFFGSLRQALGFERSWFEEWAETEIRARANPAMLPEAGTLTPGDDYFLLPDRRATGKPVYYVMRSADGYGTPDYLLDATGAPLMLRPEAAWTQAMRTSGAAERELMERRRRELDARPDPVAPPDLYPTGN